ncbi:MAG: hypothetical protein IJP92_02000, partial [Lachnospiraceae bacterium]|nr:hypothetical protein [Lachnospiraceae bacterium]
MEHDGKKTGSLRIVLAFSLLLFATALVLCMRIRFSDGDDAFFLEHTASRSLAEFVSWRYQTWSGRIFAESAIWITFRAGIVFWRIVNALMLTALPLLMLRLAEGSFSRLCRQENRRVLLLLLTVSGVYLLLSLRTAGYACIWITGSLNYLHGAVFATAALISFGDALDAERRTKASPSGEGTQAGRRMLPKYAAGILCAALGAGFAEQIAAIVFALMAIGCVQNFYLHHEIRLVPVLMTLCSFAVLLVSLLAPGNALRNATSEEWYFPGFSSLSVSARCILTLQYVLSSFSNENSLLFCLLS